MATRASPAGAPRAYQFLVLDDGDPFRTSICRLLELYGHRVEAASTAAEARKILADGEEPDVILLDAAMPGENGVDLHDLLAPRMRPRVVFMTCNPGQTQALALQRAMAERVLIKPFSHCELLALVERLDLGG